MNPEIIVGKLEFLINSAKKRGTEQGVKTFGHHLAVIKTAADDNRLLEEFRSLYQSLCGMQRFADFTAMEWQAVEEIFKELDHHKTDVMDDRQPQARQDHELESRSQR